MKRKLKGTLSLLLCMIMVVSILPFSTFAENNSDLNPDMAYYTDSGMGKIVNNLSKETKAKESEDYYILDTQVSESKVTVLYSAVEDCKLLVAAFDEDSGKMLGSGNSDASSVDCEATVTLDCTLPSEYIIKAYLVGEELSALSAEYIDLHHTAAFKEFLEKTPADYSEDKVVILDDDQSDFGVLDGSVIDSETSAVMTYTYNEATMTYVFKNATSEVKALAIGDVFYYEYGEKTNEFILFKVKSIDVSGSTVTIVEDENISLGDAFKYIRIDEKADFSQVDIDENELGEALSPVPDPQLAPSRLGAIDKNKKATFSQTYNLQCKINDNASITGSLGLSLSIEARLYYDVKLLGKDYCEFKTEINANAEYKVSVTGSIAIDKEKGRLPIPEIPLGPFSLKISLYPVASFSGSAEFSASLKLKYTVTYDSETSELKKGAWSDVTPKAEISEKAEIKIGLGLEFNLSLLKVFNVSLAGEGGAKATLLMNTGLSLWLDKHHSCAACFDGAVNFFVNIKLSAGIKIIPKILEFKADAVNWTYEKYLFDFYVSLSSDGFKCGKGECPNVEYSVVFTITGRDGKPVEGATVRSDTGRCDAHGDGKYDDTSVKTDKDGKAVFYFKKGSHTFTVSKDGETKSESFKIVAVPKTITVKLDVAGTGGGTDPNPNPGGDTYPTPTPGILDKLTYEIEDGKVTITDCDTSLSGDIVLPSKIEGKPVTSIGDDAFYKCSSLTSITIPDSVTSIGSYAFYDCSSLTSITIPDSVTSIGSYAFNWCDSLTSITIPNSVTSIGWAFDGCDKLNQINVDTANTVYSSVNGVLFNKDKTELIRYPEGKTDTSYSIPDSVTSIGGNAFEYCSSLTSITIPNSVTSIGWAFDGCDKLNQINVDTANTVYSSENGVLFNKDKTELIRYPEGKTDTSYAIPNSVTSIGYSAFEDCSSLTSVTIPESVTSIGDDAFYRTGIYNDESNWENGVLYIGNYLIKAKSTLSGEYVVKSGTKCIANCAFEDCRSLTSVTIPDSITSIGNRAFEDCSSLTSVAIPDSVTSIGDSAFWDCSSLASITIPDSVTSIDYRAFEGCSSLTSVYISDIASWCGIAFDSSDSNPLGSGASLYLNGKLVTDLIIPNSVTNIGNYAFYGCSSLTSITIPDSVTSIGDSAFSNCSSLTSITIPDSVTSIGWYAFCNCSSLTSITIPNSVTSIDRDTFDGCSSLTSITIPDSVTSIDYYAFRNCSSLKDVYYSGTQEQWEKISIYDYNGCLTSATIHYGSSAPAANAGAMRAPAATAAQNTSGAVYTATAQNAVPGELYMLYAFSSGTDLSSLEYVAQLRADSGEVKFRYIPRNSGELNVIIVGKFVGSNAKLSIKSPSTTTVSYGFTLNLHANVTDLPEGARVVWSMDGSGFELIPSADGMTCGVKSVSKGSATITAKVVDKNGNAVKDANGSEITASQQLTSKAGFFQKLVAFFKKLFGSNMVIPYALNGIIK